MKISDSDKHTSLLSHDRKKVLKYRPLIRFGSVTVLGERPMVVMRPFL